MGWVVRSQLAAERREEKEREKGVRAMEHWHGVKRRKRGCTTEREGTRKRGAQSIRSTRGRDARGKGGSEVENGRERSERADERYATEERKREKDWKQGGGSRGVEGELVRGRKRSMLTP